MMNDPAVRRPDRSPAASFRAGGATAGLAVGVAFAALAAAIAWGVLNLAWVTQADLAVAAWLRGHSDPALTRLMLAVSRLHATPSVWLASLALCGYFVWRRRRDGVVLTLLVLPGGTLFNWGLKHVFQRARPTEGIYVQALHSFSFPSGHTIAATLFYGLLLVWMGSACYIRVGQRVILAAVAIVCVAAVAFSRLYLGVHFLSDVLAAFCVGVAWLSLWTTAVFRWKANRHDPS